MYNKSKITPTDFINLGFGHFFITTPKNWIEDWLKHLNKIRIKLRIEHCETIFSTVSSTIIIIFWEKKIFQRKVFFNKKTFIILKKKILLLKWKKINNINTNLFFINFKADKKLMPEVFATKNFKKIISVNKKNFFKDKSLQEPFYIQTHLLNFCKNWNIFFQINKKYIFKFFNNILKYFTDINKNKNIFIKIIKFKKYIRFVKKFPSIKKKYIKRANRRIIISF